MQASNAEKLKHYGVYTASTTNQYKTPSGLCYANFNCLNNVSNNNVNNNNDVNTWARINAAFYKKYFSGT